MFSSTRNWIAASAAALTLAVAAPAMAEVAPMPLGMRTLPPTGFTDFCRRQPAECEGAPVAVMAATPQAAPVQTASTRPAPAPAPSPLAPRPRTNWRLAPTTTSSITPPSPADVAMPAAVPLAAPRPEAAPAAPVDAALDARLQAKAALMQVMRAKRFNPKSLNPGDWSRLTGDARLDRPVALPAAPPLPRAAPRGALLAPPPQAPAAAIRAATPVTLDLLTRVNRQQNRRIARADDMRLNGREDVWSLPTGDRPQGDCEDYVLAKRQALIAAGVSPDALSIAVVRTRRGEGHAVLLARTSQGEYVLDNLSPWVIPWNEAPYTWVSRQTVGAGRPWVQIGGPAPTSTPGARVIHISLAAG